MPDATFRRKAFFTVALTLSLIVLLLFTWRIRNVLLLGFAAVIFATLLRTSADALHSKLRLPEGLGLSLIVLLLVGCSLLLLWLIVPPFIVQVGQLATRLPTLVGDAHAQLSKSSWSNKLLSASPNANELMSSVGVVGERINATLSSASALLANSLLVFALGVFLAINPTLYRTASLRLLPPSAQPRAKALVNSLGDTLRSWLLGEFVAMFFVGLMTYLAMLLLGVPLPLALGILAGLLDFIPLFGPVIAALPALLLAASSGLSQVVWVLVAYTIIQQVEGNILQPVVQERAVSIPPALLLFSLVVMGTLFGLLGLLVATPLTAVVLVIVQKLYEEPMMAASRETKQAP